MGSSSARIWGALRMGEVLCPLAGVFDEQSSLLVSDVRISQKVQKLWIRSPKKCTPSGDIIEVFPVPNSSFDPIKAVLYFYEMRKHIHGDEAGVPFFIEEDGKCFTKKKFNKLLRTLLDPFILGDRDKLCGHSFRSGLATLMEAAGMSEEDIKAWGRWSSEAFRRYCKEGRPRNRIFAMLYRYI